MLTSISGWWRDFTAIVESAGETVEVCEDRKKKNPQILRPTKRKNHTGGLAMRPHKRIFHLHKNGSTQEENSPN